MPIAIFDPFSGIAGDMVLGSLVDLGLPADWMRGLPQRLGLDGVRVQITDVQRAGIACRKVDFEIPPQPHGRHIKQIRALVEASSAPAEVRERADRVFTAIATAEAEIHGTTPEKIHLHEVGAVDAILDVVGAIWGLAELGVTEVYCGPIALGDGTVRAAHGILPVPAPATLKLLEGHRVRPGPDDSGELVTPTGAALVRVLSSGPPPAEFTPLRSGFGAGTKEFKGRANALRIILAEATDTPPASRGRHDESRGSTEQPGGVRTLSLLAADIDDMTGESLSAVADSLRRAGALDVVLINTLMKKGRPAVRVEILCNPDQADALEDLLLTESSTIGVRRSAVLRRALPRSRQEVDVLGHTIAVKVVTLPDGTSRGKPEHEEAQRVASETGRPLRDVLRLASEASERR